MWFNKTKIQKFVGFSSLIYTKHLGHSYIHSDVTCYEKFVLKDLAAMLPKSLYIVTL